MTDAGLLVSLALDGEFLVRAQYAQESRYALLRLNKEEKGFSPGRVPRLPA